MGMFPSKGESLPMVRCDEVSLAIEPAKNGTLPLPICIEVPGGRTHEVIPAGVRLPYTTTQMFSTVDSYQMAAEFHLVAGSRPLVRDNIDLGRVRVRDIKWSGAGTPKLEVTFKFDKNGMLTVAAKNRDRKATEMLAYVATDHLDAAQVEAALAAEAAAAADDERTEGWITEMLKGYALIDKAYERHAYAKRKMNFIQKRQYKTARKALQKALNVMPPEATEETMAELREAYEVFNLIYDQMLPLEAAVKGWYEK